MPYQCAHRWAFNTWGGPLEQGADELAPLADHEVDLHHGRVIGRVVLQP